MVLSLHGQIWRSPREAVVEDFKLKFTSLPDTHSTLFFFAFVLKMSKFGVFRSEEKYLKVKKITSKILAFIQTLNKSVTFV
jgi:hypothetical protein